MRLLTMSTEDMIAYFDRLEAQSKAIKEEVLRLCWYMRGGLDYNDAMLLSLDERKIISKIVKDNLETSRKSGMPFF
jgi:hypothetical protein